MSKAKDKCIIVAAKGAAKDQQQVSAANGGDVCPEQQLILSSESAKPKVTNVHTMTSSDFYLDLDAHIEIFADRMKDHYSIRHFKDAILYNRHLFQGRTVLDIGCGMGLLSMFSAKAGAQRVFAVDCSNVLDYTRQIVHENGYDDVIHLIKGHIENIELPVTEVDIIVCDWVGYSLLFQSKCEAVIYARDKWLKRDGLIFPDVAKLFVAAVTDTHHKNQRIEWWNSVYGFNMKCVRKFALSEPRFQLIKHHQVISAAWKIKSLDLNKATKDDLQFRSKFSMKMCSTGWMDGIMTYFQVGFSKAHKPISFSTDPSSPRTRWLQTVFYFDDPCHVRRGNVYYGGVQMVPLNGDYDLKNIQVNFEMFRFTQDFFELEVEMFWQLITRSHVTNDEEKKKIVRVVNEHTSNKAV